MGETAEDLYERLLRGDRRAAARIISMVENWDPASHEIVRRLHRHAGRARIVGLTGLPGSGKSTLACRIAEHYRKRGVSLGIIAIDPTSPFTGGALLGDRVRMQDLASDPEVFIRSMGSRGALGGLSVATNDAINVMDAFGKELVMVETVGAGQVEVDIIRYCHTCVVVTMPGGGDEIQAIKAGILEIGDVFVVNKADREGAERTAADLEMMLETKPGYDEALWKQPVIMTVALEDEGVDKIVEALDSHWRYLNESGQLEEKTRERMKAELIGILNFKVAEAAGRALAEDSVGMDLLERLMSREIDPHTAAEKITEYLLSGGIR